MSQYAHKNENINLSSFVQSSACLQNTVRHLHGRSQTSTVSHFSWGSGLLWECALRRLPSEDDGAKLSSKIPKHNVNGHYLKSANTSPTIKPRRVSHGVVIQGFNSSLSFVQFVVPCIQLHVTELKQPVGQRRYAGVPPIII